MSTSGAAPASVFVGTLFGVVPFILLAVAFPSFLATERFVFYGVVPLVLVPITFAYAIIRFQLLDIRVILRKSLLYAVTTALVTALYALGIASFNRIFHGTQLADSPYFPVVFALAIVLLFEPLRHRLQRPVDRFFFAERQRLQRAMVEMGEALTNEIDIGPVITQLVERLPELLGLHFAALYLPENGRLRRVAGPTQLPAELPILGILHDFLKKGGPPASHGRAGTDQAALGRGRATRPRARRRRGGGCRPARHQAPIGGHHAAVR